MESNQLDLFSKKPQEPVTRQETLVMDAQTLVRWKSQIYEYQQRVRESQPAQQTTLFEVVPIYCEPDKIDPFSLTPQSMAFWRFPADSPGEACIYFVIDSAAQLLLYVGETCRSNKRWKGTHDCKRYIEKYQELHYKYGLQTAVNMAFWWDVPVDTRPRQQLELGLIQKWIPPFNKQNWGRWGQPFNAD